jgi:serine/threonine-protein kinase
MGPLPVKIAGITGALDVVVGDRFACARTGTAVYCWGTAASQSIPTQIDGIISPVQIATGGSKVCAVRVDGTTACWNAHDTTAGPGPVTNATAIALGTQGGCAIVTGGQVQCWGDNTNGEVGNGAASDTPVATPVTVMGITNAKGIALGDRSSCAFTADGSAYCWGDNGEGAVGDGTYADRYVPTLVTNIGSVAEVGALSGNACALNAVGLVYCWGHLNSLLDDGKHTELEDSSADWNIKVPVAIGL